MYYVKEIWTVKLHCNLTYNWRFKKGKFAQIVILLSNIILSYGFSVINTSKNSYYKLCSNRKNTVCLPCVGYMVTFYLG